MFDEFFDKCALENEVQTSSEFTDKIKEKLSKKLHTPASSKEDNLMKHINIAKTVISAAAVAALGAVSMLGASADSVSTLTYTSADGKELGSVTYQVSSENGTLSEVGTVTIDGSTFADYKDENVDIRIVTDENSIDSVVAKIKELEGKDSEVVNKAVTLTSDDFTETLVKKEEKDANAHYYYDDGSEAYGDIYFRVVKSNEVVELTKDDFEFGAVEYTEPLWVSYRLTDADGKVVNAVVGDNTIPQKVTICRTDAE